MINFNLLDDNISYIDKQKPLFLYGAGNIGKEVCKALIKKGFTIEGFVDARVEKTEYCDSIPIFPLINLPIIQSSTVIVTIHNRDVFMPPIITKLKDLGFKSVLTMIDVFDLVSDVLNDRFWLTKKEYYRSSSTNLEEGYYLWEDDKSKNLYKSIIEFRMSGNYGLLPEKDEPQYFPKDIPQWNEPIRMIDAGAYDGDTIKDLLKEKNEVSSIVTFEPDMDNFLKLSKFIRTIDLKFDVYLYPCGVWSNTATLKFQIGEGEASHISDSENVNSIQCVALDDVLPNFHPTLIKMDIEGAEIEALIGAKEIIQKFRPGLAICVYHHPDHIWKIPKLIKSFDDRYSLFLRSHAYNSFELVLYAIPR